MSTPGALGSLYDDCHVDSTVMDRQCDTDGCKTIQGDTPNGSGLSDPSTASIAGVTKLSGRQKFTMASLAISNFCASLAFSIIAPFFPQEATNKGATDTEIGLIFGVFQLTIFCMAPIYGTVIAKVGPKFMYVAGCFTCSVCLVLFGFLDKCPDGPIYVAMCFICRIVEANGSAMFMTASFAILANQFPSQLSTVMGLLETFSGIGMMVGPPIGGALYTIGGFRLPFIVVGCTLAASCVSSYLLLPVLHSSKGTGRFFALLKIPKLVMIFFVMCSATFALSFLDPTLSKHIAKADPNLNPAEIGAVFLLGCGVYALSAPLVGYLCDKGILMSMVFTGSVLLGIGYLLIGPSPLLSFLPRSQLWLVCTSLVCVGLGVSGALLPTFSLSLQSALKAGYSDSLETHGLISGFFNCAFSLGAFLGPSAAGAASDKYGFEWAATGCALLNLIVAAVAGVSGAVGYARDRKAAACLVVGISPDTRKDEKTPLLAVREDAA